MTERYNIIFRGDVVPGHNLADVKSSLKNLFKLEDSKLDQLFSGRPIAIKKNLEKAVAEQFSQKLAQVGALVDLKAIQVEDEPSAPSPQPAAPPPSPAVQTSPPAPEEGGINLAPEGTDVLTESERSQQAAVEVTTDHLSLDAPGADVLRPEERKPVEDLELDLSHLKVEAP